MQYTQETVQKDHVLPIPAQEIERIGRLLGTMLVKQLDMAVVGDRRETGKLEDRLLAWLNALARQFGRYLAVLIEKAGMPTQAGLGVEGR